MTLVTGAGGKTGQAVIRALVARGVRPRALARRPEQVDELLSIGAAEAVQGDLLDASSLEPAFSGIRAVYHIGPNVPYALGDGARGPGHAAPLEQTSR
ncbi:MAG TPA: NAD(P)-dependent oxidoreductase [Gemmatimonadetes bacterium]|nr:NAD(P)-dependent oxidoreductase [Gemmatimonadota bacterium]